MKFFRDINTLESISIAKATLRGQWMFEHELRDFDYTYGGAVDYTRNKSITETRNWLKNKTINFRIYVVRLKDTYGNEINAMCVEVKDPKIAALYKLTWC